MTYILFVIGFVMLVKGADLLIEGASAIAKRSGISDLVIGLTVVAFGTSAPEFAVNILASIRGNSDLAISNVLGSNIANTCLAIGIAAMMTPLIVKRNTVTKEIPLGVLAALVLGVAVNDRYIDGATASMLTRTDGFLMLGFFSVFFFYTINLAIHTKEKNPEHFESMPVGKSVLWVVLGLVGLTVGGDWIVKGAIEIATAFGMSEILIGMTIVAIGTSLPEIVTCAVSAYKGRNNIAIGNAVGSNLFNILWVLSVSSIVNPIPFDETLNLDVAVNVFVSFLLFVFLFYRNPKHTITKAQGILFMMIYFGYITASIMRG